MTVLRSLAITFGIVIAMVIDSTPMAIAAAVLYLVDWAENKGLVLEEQIDITVNCPLHAGKRPPDPRDPQNFGGKR